MTKNQNISKNRFVPMLFSTPMVQAILNETKTETRRTQDLEKINENPDLFLYDGFEKELGCHYFERINFDKKPLEKYMPIKSKVNIGDIIWVRETWGIDYFGSLRFWHFKELLHIEKSDIVYKADDEKRDKRFLLEKVWKPSIYMPKEVCRIFLKCVSVHVERLQDIDEQSAINEGAIHGRYLGLGQIGGSVREGYFELWDKINGKESVFRNPFVWVYKFERIDKPNDFC